MSGGDNWHKPDGDDRGLARLRVESYLPSMRALALVLGGVLFLACGAYPVISGRYKAWNSGEIASSHSLIAGDCRKCHANSFQRVADSECLSCHRLSEHGADPVGFNHAHPELGKRCAECHMEHNGDAGLISSNADFCVDCHSSMRELKPDSTLLNVDSFDGHPQFRVDVQGDDGSIKRVPLDDRAQAIDTARLKLNHAAHLKPGLLGAGGKRVNLECGSCHELSDDFKKMRPVTYDKHCKDCHGLGLDERLPDAQVPHGDAEAVFPALFSEYAKLFLLGGATGGAAGGARVEQPERLLPEGAAEPTNELEGDAKKANQAARDAERELFTRTGCFLCHSYALKPDSERSDTNSHYSIDRPGVRPVWLPAARFDHGAHEEFSCQSCHSGADKSSKTGDILLPGVAGCRECHAQGAGAGQVESGCGLCHSYHAGIGFPAEKKQSIEDYLNSLTR